MCHLYVQCCFSKTGMQWGVSDVCSPVFFLCVFYWLESVFVTPPPSHCLSGLFVGMFWAGSGRCLLDCLFPFVCPGGSLQDFASASLDQTQRCEASGSSRWETDSPRPPGGHEDALLSHLGCDRSSPEPHQLPFDWEAEWACLWRTPADSWPSPCCLSHCLKKPCPEDKQHISIMTMQKQPPLAT